MSKLNENYLQLKESYLFSEIAHRTAAYSEKHPDKPVIRLGIGDVTRPLCECAIKALHESVDEMGQSATFKGYGPEQGYAKTRDAIAAYYKRNGVEVDADAIFISDGAKSDTGNITELFGHDNVILIPDPVYPVYVDSNTMCGNLNDGQTVNIIMCDIDHFKQVNDTYGHDAGDIILKGVADVLQEGTRAGADCAFRMGGEEMVCIINSEPEVAMDIAERLRSTIENTVHNIQHEGKPLDVKVTVSMGVHTMDPKGAVTPENARKVFDKEFKHADKAVYDAKESGRNRVVNNNELTNLKYLALKAAEVMCGGDRSLVNEMKEFAVSCLVNEKPDQNHNTVIEALKGVAEQNPTIADTANKIADKISEKFPDAEKAPEKTVKFFNKNEYKNIENKAYINTDSKTGFNITQKAQKEGVTVSAKFSEGKATITLDAVKDKAFIDAVENIGKWAEKVQVKYAEKHSEKTQENNKNKDNNAR